MILFDLDGTLVDSRSAILSAYFAAVRSIMGYELEPDEDHVHDLLRRRPVEYFRQHYPPAAEALAEQYAVNYQSDSVVAFPGVTSVLDSFAASTPVGIVSNKGRARILSDLEWVGLDPARFHVIVGAEDTARRKPHPDPILKAVAGVRPAPTRVGYVGDGPHDVIAARAAGACPVAVTWGYYPEQALVAAGAEHLVTDIETLSELLTRELA
jgi:phosphoglycolate phosphatase-like HAD superfamily hydrolase